MQTILWFYSMILYLIILTLKLWYRGMSIFSSCMYCIMHFICHWFFLFCFFSRKEFSCVLWEDQTKGNIDINDKVCNDFTRSRILTQNSEKQKWTEMSNVVHCHPWDLKGHFWYECWTSSEHYFGSEGCYMMLNPHDWIFLFWLICILFAITWEMEKWICKHLFPIIRLYC